MTWAKSTMPDGVLSSIECIQHSMRLRLVETSSSLPTARVSGRSVSRRWRPVSSESMQRRRCANSLWRSCRMPVTAMSSSGLTISSAGSQIRTMTSSSLRSRFRTFPRAISTGSGAASTTRFAPGGRFFLVDAARAVLERNVIHGSRLPNRESATELQATRGRSEVRIFKRSFDPDRLARDLRDHGLDASFVETGEFFVYGLGRRA